MSEEFASVRAGQTPKLTLSPIASSLKLFANLGDFRVNRVRELVGGALDVVLLPTRGACRPGDLSHPILEDRDRQVDRARTGNESRSGGRQMRS